jgi:phage terminase small subunit
MKLSTIEGGGLPEPKWATLFSDKTDQAAAKAHWAEIVTALKEAETLALANAHMVKRLVLVRIAHDAAAVKVAEQGLVIEAKNTDVPQYNPWWIAMRQASADATQLEGELCIPPRRRASAGKVVKKKTSARAADAYLKPVRK